MVTPKEINLPFFVFHADSSIHPETTQPRSSMTEGTGQKFCIVLQGIFLMESDNSQMPWQTQNEEALFHDFYPNIKCSQKQQTRYHPDFIKMHMKDNHTFLSAGTPVHRG